MQQTQFLTMITGMPGIIKNLGFASTALHAGQPNPLACNPCMLPNFHYLACWPTHCLVCWPTHSTAFHAGQPTPLPSMLANPLPCMLPNFHCLSCRPTHCLVALHVAEIPLPCMLANPLPCCRARCRNSTASSFRRPNPSWGQCCRARKMRS